MSSFFDASYFPGLPAGVNVRITCRYPYGGVSGKNGAGESKAPYDAFNLATHVGDDSYRVAANRRQLNTALGFDGQNRVAWLNQIHGTEVIKIGCGFFASDDSPPDADASWTSETGLVCAILTADCLPVLISSHDGSKVGVAHAGWRSLCSGILDRLLDQMNIDNSRAWVGFGPAIGPKAYEVGEDFRAGFNKSAVFDGLDISSAFVEKTACPVTGEPKYLADLYQLARIKLWQKGVQHIEGGDQCSWTQSQVYYSHRRDGVTGRMASLIWMCRD